MSMKLRLTDQLLARGQELHQQNNDDEALKVLGRLASFRALPAEVAELAHASLAEILIRRRKLTRARRHLTVALLYRPDCARYHYWMALALAGGRTADPDRAANHYRKALELDPEMTDCLADFAWFCLKQGEAEEGIEALRRAVDLEPDKPALLQQLVEALRLVGRDDEARTTVRDARFRHPRDPRFERLWNDLRFQETVAAQQSRRQRAARPGRRRLVLLPFVRPAGSEGLVRADGPATLPPPHAPLRPARRRDLKHG